MGEPLMPDLRAGAVHTRGLLDSASLAENDLLLSDGKSHASVEYNSASSTDIPFTAMIFSWSRVLL